MKRYDEVPQWDFTIKCHNQESQQSITKGSITMKSHNKII